MKGYNKSYISVISASVKPSPTYIQGVSEIGGQTLRAYSTHHKDKKKSFKHGFRNASFRNYKYFLFTDFGKNTLKNFLKIGLAKEDQTHGLHVLPI